MNKRNLAKFQLKIFSRASIILISVLLLVNIFQLLVKLFLPSVNTGTDGIILGVSRNIIVIFTTINVVTANQVFPMMSSFSATRKNFYFSTVLAFTLFSLAAALAETVLFEIWKALAPSLDMEISSGKPFLIHWYLFAASLTVISLALFVIVSCFQRFGTVRGIFSVVLYIAIINVAASLVPSLNQDDTYGLLPLLSEGSPLGSTFPLWAAAVLLVATGWLMYRRAPVRM